MANTPLITAHRGLHDESAGIRENTMAAVRSALNHGVDLIEIDVQLTKDGHIIVLHDAALERLWGDPRRTVEVDLEDIQDIGGGQKRIPTLEEILTLMRGTGVTLVLDLSHEWLALPTVQLVQRMGTDVDVAWCGNSDALRIVHREILGAQIWLPWSKSQAPTRHDLNAFDSTVISVSHLFVGQEFVDAVHSLGATVNAWTVNDPHQASHLASIGVDALTTDHVQATRDAIDQGQPDEDLRRISIVTALINEAIDMIPTGSIDEPVEYTTKKDAADHVTQTDLRVEEMIRQVLGAQFPDHRIVGEEYGGTDDGDHLCWYLDPVDGTANLANGVPWTSCSIALLDHGIPQIAAIIDPAGRTSIIAARGKGVWRDSQSIDLLEQDKNPDPLRGAIVTAELAGAAPWPGFHQFLDALASRHCTLRVPGSGTATLAGVALRRGAAALVHRYNPIDHAASILIVEEAGGVVIDSSGEATSSPCAGPVITAQDMETAQALYSILTSCLDGA